MLEGAPTISGPVDGLRDAGGYLGAVIGAPLAAGLGTVGASVVLVGVLLFGARSRRDLDPHGRGRT